MMIGLVLTFLLTAFAALALGYDMFFKLDLGPTWLSRLMHALLITVAAMGIGMAMRMVFTKDASPKIAAINS
jgi:hypothetical protein